jgi:lipid-A-disaccharide synthase
LRYFFSTGEASGELNAVLLGRAIAEVDAAAQFEGIGAERMMHAQWRLWRNHTGWASMGPLAAIPRIPRLYATMWRTALHINESKPDLLVLVDFGAFNMRLAKTLRTQLDYQAPIMYLFPPATWLDKENVARAVGTMTVPVTAFAHQYEFYKANRLPIMFFGHPLAAQYEQRASRPAPPQDGGEIALLPGSRGTELQYHVPAMLGALRELRVARPRLRAVFGAANAACEKALLRAVKRARVDNVRVVHGVAEAIADADAAFVASGTAVLETVLSGVPSVLTYIINPVLVRHARSIYSGRFIGLPNLVLGRELVPELLQDEATPQALAAAMEAVLQNPAQQYTQFAEVRARLGPHTALNDCAKFAVALAKAGQR